MSPPCLCELSRQPSSPVVAGRCCPPWDAAGIRGDVVRSTRVLSIPLASRFSPARSPACSARGSPPPWEEPCVKGLQPRGLAAPGNGQPRLGAAALPAFAWLQPRELPLGCWVFFSPSLFFFETANPGMSLCLNSSGKVAGRQGVGCAGPLRVATEGGKGLGVYRRDWDIPASPARASTASSAPRASLL